MMRKPNPITVTDKLQSTQINELLKDYTSVSLDLSDIGYDAEYYYGLVTTLSNCIVLESRPIQRITIEREIESSYLLIHKEDILEAIKEYSDLRTQIFKDFLDHLNIENTDSVFRDIIGKIRGTIQFNKGSFGDWEFWQHGGDIEFKNIKTVEHINVLMFNREAINPRSLIQFLKAKSRFEPIIKTISDNLQNLERIMDLLVIEGSLLDIENKLRMKIITLNK